MLLQANAGLANRMAMAVSKMRINDSSMMNDKCESSWILFYPTGVYVLCVNRAISFIASFDNVDCIHTRISVKQGMYGDPAPAGTRR